MDIKTTRRLCRGLRRGALVLAVAVVVQATPALAGPAYDALIEANDSYVAAVQAHDKALAEREAFVKSLNGQDPFSFVGERRRRYISLEQAVAAASGKRDSADAAYKSALTAWKAEIKPYTDLEAAARSAMQQLAVQAAEGGTEINRVRALRAIELDLPKIYPGGLSRVAQANQEIEGLLRAGRPVKEIEEQVASRYGDDPAARQLLGELFGALEEKLNDAPGADRVKAFTEQLDRLSKISKLVGFFAPSQSDPLKSTEVGTLTSLVDIASDYVPLKPVAAQLQIQKVLLEGIQNNLSQLQFEAIRRNLSALVNGGKFRTAEYGDAWAGLNSSLLFGIPAPHPAIQPAKTSYREGEPITGQFYGSLRYAESAWLGIVPSGVAHGSETVADQNDVAYMRTGRSFPGRFNFAPSLKPGDYDLRMYDDDSGGKEVYAVSFKVVGRMDLTGTWIGTNYICPDASSRFSERVRVVQTGDRVIATKLTGDRCVPAGNETFSGTVGGALSCVVGQPERPASQRIGGAMTGVAEDRFTACGVNFVRER